MTPLLKWESSNLSKKTINPNPSPIGNGFELYWFGVPNDIQERLLEAIERHITEYRVTEFIVGGYMSIIDFHDT